MSLVNDMLNDLDERRNNQPAKGNSLQWLTGSAPSRSKKWFLPLIIFCFILLLMIFAFFIWKNQVVSERSSADKLLARSEIVTSKNPLKKPVVKKAVPVGDNPSVSTDLPRELAKHASARLRQLEKKSTSSRVPQTVSVVGSEVDKVPLPLAVSEEPEITQEKTLGKSKEKKVVGQKVLNVESRFVKTARPPTAEQLDRQAAKKANDLLRNNRRIAAEESLSKFMESQPTALASGQLLVSIWMSQKRFDLAERLLDKLRSSSPRHVGLMIVNARLMLLTERTNMAVEMLLSERPPIGTYAAYYELLALAARQNEQYQLSEKTYRSLLSTDGNRGDWWFGLALALDAQGSQTRARSAFLRALKTNDLSAALVGYARKRASVSFQNEG